MSEILRQVGIIVFVGSLFSALGMIFQNWLAKKGIVRPNKAAIILFAFAAALIKQLWYEDLSWAIWCLLATLGLMLGVNRGDLWTTMYRGSWWWKDTNRE
jgi:hypothetical protein